MAIDFPDTTQLNPETGLPWANGDTYLDVPTGLRYFWFAPVWKRELQVTGPTDEKYVERDGDTMTGQLTLPGGGVGSEAITVDEVEAKILDGVEDIFVEKSGDTMTGDLILNSNLVDNSPKLELNALDGSAYFYSRQVNISSGVNTNEASIAIFSNNDASDIALRLETGGSEPVDIRMDGSAKFVSGLINLTSAGGISAHNAIQTNTSFVGNLSENYLPVGQLSKAIFLKGNQAVFASQDGSNHYGHFDSLGNLRIGGDANGNKIVLSNNGSAEFAGSVTANTNSSYAGVFVNNASSSNPHQAAVFARNLTSGGVVFAGAAHDWNSTDAASKTTTKIYEDGSAQFAGNIGSNGGLSATGNSWRITSAGQMDSWGEGGYGLTVADTSGGSAQTTITLNRDGSADFSGNLSADGNIEFGNGALYSTKGTSSSHRVFVPFDIPNTNTYLNLTSDKNYAFATTNSDTSTVIAGIDVSGASMFTTGKFSSEVDIEAARDSVYKQGVLIFNKGRVASYVQNSSQVATEPRFYVYNGETNEYKSRINADGSAQFAGPLSFGGIGDAHKMDEYEEGTWTPMLYVISGTHPTYTLSTNSSSYTRIGQVVLFSADITYNITSVGSGTGLYFTLPYTPSIKNGKTVYSGGPQGRASSAFNLPNWEISWYYYSDGARLYHQGTSQGFESILGPNNLIVGNYKRVNFGGFYFTD